MKSIQVLLAVALLARWTGLIYFAWKFTINKYLAISLSTFPHMPSFCKACPRKIFEDFLVENVVLVHVMPANHIPILDH